MTDSLEIELAKPLSVAQLKDMVRQRQAAVNHLVEKSKKIVQLSREEREKQRDQFEEDKKKLEGRIRDLTKALMEADARVHHVELSNVKLKEFIENNLNDDEQLQQQQQQQQLQQQLQDAANEKINEMRKLQEEEMKKLDEKSLKVKKLVQISKSLREENAELKRIINSTSDERIRSKFQDSIIYKQNLQYLCTTVEETKKELNISNKKIVELEEKLQKEVEKNSLNKAQTALNESSDLPSSARSLSKQEAIQLLSELHDTRNELANVRSELSKVKKLQRRESLINNKLRQEIAHNGTAGEEKEKSSKSAIDKENNYTSKEEKDKFLNQLLLKLDSQQQTDLVSPRAKSGCRTPRNPLNNRPKSKSSSHKQAHRDQFLKKAEPEPTTTALNNVTNHSKREGLSKMSSSSSLKKLNHAQQQQLQKMQQEDTDCPTSLYCDDNENIDGPDLRWEDERGRKGKQQVPNLRQQRHDIDDLELEECIKELSSFRLDVPLPFSGVLDAITTQQDA